ncbi:hypothetical protein [Sphingomonas sp.]|uniref:hypothetical protein n=1 Tax=Sphingomonas sp. TaxID=28214 RepID=UPI0028A72AEC|nr:hypothetical protein [Sphingomonas sp.]
MVKVFDPQVTGKTSIDGFYEEFDAIEHPFKSPQFLTEAADALARLNANKSLIHDKFAEQGGWASVKSTFQSTQSIILERRQTRYGRISLRCNFWFPLQHSKFEDLERNIYAYEMAHNHNFEFMTIGHHGTGYYTDVGVIDPNAITSYDEQAIEISNRRRIQLCEGRVLYFKMFSDIHVQHPSDEPSISLNLVLDSSEWEREQFEFDMDRGVKLGYVRQGSVERAISAVDFCRFFDSPAASQVLDKLRDQAPFTSIRNAIDVGASIKVAA